MKKGLLVRVCALVLGTCAGFGVHEPLNVTIAECTPVETGVLEQRYAVKVRLRNRTAVRRGVDRSAGGEMVRLKRQGPGCPRLGFFARPIRPLPRPPYRSRGG
jgi:hypothetical protein